jgi:kumamolisin
LLSTTRPPGLKPRRRFFVPAFGSVRCGGQSFYEKIPSYQSSISSIVGSYRGTPDLSFDANPDTGLWVYDTFPMDEYFYSWWIVGGTSASAPALAGIINRAGAFAASTNAELTTIYANKAVTADFGDITSGYCGPYMGFSAVTGMGLLHRRRASRGLRREVRWS